MGSDTIRYAIGEYGKLTKFSGKDVPAGMKALVEEDGKTLTGEGKIFCTRRGITNPNVEVIRVSCEQYMAASVVEAAAANLKNAELIPVRYEATKAASEKLRLDWAAQDKAYQEAEAAKKKAAAAAPAAKEAAKA